MFIENLSHLLLGYIVQFLEDDLDKISLTLVCKRLFEERHKYFVSFSSVNNNISMNSIYSQPANSFQDDNLFKLFSLRSYLNQYQNAINKMNNCKLFVTNNYFLKVSKFQYILRYDKNNVDSFIFPENVSHVYFDRMFSQPDQVFFGKLAGAANITSLTVNVPTNCASFDSLPNLLELYVNSPLKQFPPHLRKLRFGLLALMNVSELAFQFPETLTYLRLDRFNLPLMALPPLPPNLSVFKCFDTLKECPSTPTPSFTFTMFPPSLHTLQINTYYMNTLVNRQSNLSIKQLTLFTSCNTVFLPTTIPAGVERLTLDLNDSVMLLKDFIPTSCRSLTFKSRINAEQHIFANLKHLEALELAPVFCNETMRLGRLPHGLRRLSLPLNLNDRVNEYIGPLPDSLESLEITPMAFKTLKSVPRSLQHLKFGKSWFDPMFYGSLIENTESQLESIDFGHYDTSIEHIIPTTVKYITAPPTAIQEIGNSLISKLPPTVTTITIRLPAQSTFRNKKTISQLEYRLRKLDTQYLLVTGHNNFRGIIHQNNIERILKTIEQSI